MNDRQRGSGGTARGTIDAGDHRPKTIDAGDHRPKTIDADWIPREVPDTHDVSQEVRQR